MLFCYCFWFVLLLIYLKVGYSHLLRVIDKIAEMGELEFGRYSSLSMGKLAHLCFWSGFLFAPVILQVVDRLLVVFV